MKSKAAYLKGLPYGIALLAAWLVTARLTEPFLHFHSQQTGFLTTFSFFKTFIRYPGGPADYVAEFISQFFYFNGFGSLLIVLVAGLQGCIVLSVIRQARGNTAWGFSVFALVLLFGILVLSDYRYPYYASIRLLFAHGFTWIFLRLYRKYNRVSLVAWPALAFLLFYMASGPALFMFTLSSVLILLPGKPFNLKKAAAAILFLSFAGLLPWFSYHFLFRVALSDLYRITVVKHPELLAYTTWYQLYLCYALLPLLLLLFSFRLRSRERKPDIRTAKGKAVPKTAVKDKTLLFSGLQFAGIVLLGFFLFSKAHDPLKKNLLTIEYYADHGQWHELLNTAEKIAVYDFRVNFQINRAYAHLGQLPDRLFNYPQLLGVKALFYDNTNINGSLTMPNSDLYFDLGFMSESQHWAFEAQTLMPHSPRILKRLVMIQLVNRKYQLAGQFLSVLGQNPLCRDWVRHFKPYCTDTLLAANDPLIAEKRRFNPSRVYVHTHALDDLKLLYDTNPENRLAYDYLLAHCMLSSGFEDFIRYLSLYPELNRKPLPRSWEEALSVYMMRFRTVPDFVGGETISKETLQRFTGFNNILKQNNNNLQAARGALQQRFENSYWYYLLYLDPKVTKAFDKKTTIR